MDQTTDNPTLQSEKLEPPNRVWLTRKEISGHQTWVQASGHDDGEYEYVRVPVAALQGTSRSALSLKELGSIHRDIAASFDAAPSPSSPGGLYEAEDVYSDPVPPEQKHHKHCSSWTVNTSGERQPCDCVCECSHTMFEHIRPGEHSWYEDCAVEGCACMKFIPAATPVTPSSAARKAAREWMNTHHASFKTNRERENALAVIISRYFPVSTAGGDEGQCAWTLDDVMDGDLWETGCGEAFQFTDGGPADNKFAFCYKCGKRISIGRYSDDTADSVGEESK